MEKGTKKYKRIQQKIQKNTTTISEGLVYIISFDKYIERR